MTVWHSLYILVAIVAATNVVLTAAIIRRLRAGSPGPRRTDIRPAPGFRVVLDNDGHSWSADASSLTGGVALVALVAPGCAGCDNLRRALERADSLPYPLHLVIDGTHDNSGAYATQVSQWPHVTSVHRAPGSADTLASFDHPTFVPTITLLADGFVVASGYRLKDVTDAVARPKQPVAAAQ